MKQLILYTFLLTLFSLIISLPVMSYSPFSDQVNKMYSNQVKCEVCHIGARLNAYGNDFKKSWYKNKDLKLIDAFRQIAKIDSDNDGFSNEEELKAGTLPGDKISFPLTPKKDSPVSVNPLKHKE